MVARRSAGIEDPGEIWRPQPGPQALLLSCPIPDVLFGGARGGGKSDALLGDWVAHAGRAKGKAGGVIFRRTMPELEELIARSHELYHELGAEWSASRKTWVFPCGATLKMRWLDRDQDADHYQGHQNTYIGFDEAGTWPEPAPIDKLRATLRSPHGVPCLIRLTANPGGSGQQWLTQRYITPAPAGVPFFDAERKTWRVFIPARLGDNRKLIEADPGYEDRIRSSGPAWLVRAWLDGDWSASAGQAFFTENNLLVPNAEGGHDPIADPDRCDYVAAVIDTAVKTGSANDGTGIVYIAIDKVQRRLGHPPLRILDWDIQQIEGALLETWLPTVFQNLEHYAELCGARYGSGGVWIEDKSSGMVLLQQAQRRGWPAQPIESALTSVGKDERAISVSGYVYRGEVKLTERAFNKIVTYKDVTRNHLLSQVTGFRVGDKDARTRQDDLLDAFCYSIALSLGDSGAF